jgi:hypothetical protein
MENNIAEAQTTKQVQKWIVGTWKIDKEVAKPNLIQNHKKSGTYKEFATEKAVDNFLMSMETLKLTFLEDNTFFQSERGQKGDKLKWKVKDAASISLVFDDGYTKDLLIQTISNKKLVFKPEQEGDMPMFLEKE